MFLKKVLKLIVSKYAVEEYDWMRFKITEENPLTYHHIRKKSEGGDWSVSNGAPLTREAQCYLHYIEQKDVRTYNEINGVLRAINSQGFGPTDKQRKKLSI